MNIIITGGTRGIGRNLAQLLAKDPNNRILVTGRQKDALKSLSDSAEFNNIITLALDLTLLTTKAQTFKKFVFSQFSNIDILINNAGALVSRPFTELSENESREMMEVNFFAPATIIRTLMPLMNTGAHIVNISSMGGVQGSSKYPGLSIYSSSKAAIACLTECLAEEFRSTGIKVNCLALGTVQTEMLEEAFPGYKAPVNARDMAGFIMEFALNGNKYFNGKILPVALNNP
jgi:3-oxoacyl-[acyl-carrier protein] reductase